MLEPTTIAIMVFVVLFVLLFFGAPIFAALGFASIVGLFLTRGVIGLMTMPLTFFDIMNNFVLAASMPFIFMAQALIYTGIGEQLYDFGAKWLGRLPGGLCIASIAACAIFGTIMGTSMGAAVTIGMVAIPEMRKRGYDPTLATGVVAAAGALAILIPPSLPMIFYGVVTEVSVGKLFIAGVIPGIVLAVLMMVYVIIVVLVRPKLAPAFTVRYSWKERFISLGKIWPVAALIIMILGAMYTGMATPTEAAGVGAVGALLINFIFYRKLTWQNFYSIIKLSARLTGMFLIIVGCATIFGSVLTQLQVPQRLTAYIAGVGVSGWMVIVLINVLLIVLGCFLDPTSIIVIIMPIFGPVITALGYDLIWFGIIMTINMEMAVITPPLGMNVFGIHGITPDVSMGAVFRGALPFVLVEAVAIALVMIFPQLALWLPSKMV